jgi:hypothetical protein
VPVGLAALVLSALFVPESRAPRARGVDLVGQLLVIMMLASLTYAIIEGPGADWTSARTLGSFGVAAAAFTGLIYCEPRRDEPLIDLRFFRSAPFSGATVIAEVTSYPAGIGDVSAASEMGPALRHDLGATQTGYVSIMVWLGRGRQPGWGLALVFSRQGCPRTTWTGRTNQLEDARACASRKAGGQRWA